MSYELKKVGKYIDDKIREYQDLLLDENLKEEPDKDKITLYGSYIKCLSKLNKDLFYPSDFDNQHIIEKVLEANHGEYDTLLVLDNNTKLTLGMNSLFKVEDNYLCIYDKKAYENDSTVVPPIRHLINLNYIHEAIRVEYFNYDLDIMGDMKKW